MINSLYQVFNKGSLRTLSFLLAILITLCFFFNLADFSTQLRHQSLFLILFLIWGTLVLWIHGIGFEIRSTIWRIVFFPALGYIAVVLAVMIIGFNE
ncbi:cyd operon protein YbgE [Pasteurella sp. PK-2025]|uniref:cyd operon protein YbgE n=1 Tax=unclassified Pasteurella TaxID=2621516 RepID=UPI003C716407